MKHSEKLIPPYRDVEVSHKKASEPRATLTTLLGGLLAYPLQMRDIGSSSPFLANTHFRPDVHRVDYKREYGYAGYRHMFESVYIWGNWNEICCTYTNRSNPNINSMLRVCLYENGAGEVKEKTWIDVGRQINTVRHGLRPITDEMCGRLVLGLEGFLERSEIHLTTPPPIQFQPRPPKSPQ